MARSLRAAGPSRASRAARYSWAGPGRSGPAARGGRARRAPDRARTRPVIDRTLPVEEIVEAHRYVDTGRKRGAVVLRVRPEDGPGDAGRA
ncbi:zinc-binding dehydrogenase [Cellulomonas flavigena]|uniref:zinc-binding dehydrogenase n=1 Tax=Cellulomonas flavigena TaxID=1711 RepID=UPI0009D6B7D4|nr:zinc-binding dehydrogenase [Cellulomonas flavigena]